MAKRYQQLSKILSKLLYDRRMTAAGLARAVKLPAATVHRLVTGKSTRPYESSLKPIAQYFSLEIPELLGEKPLPEEASVRIITNQAVHMLPLMPWSKLGDVMKPQFCAEKKSLPQTIPVVGDIHSQAFAAVMPDSSMEPLVPKNAVLIFDPSLLPADGSFVLAKLHETQAFVLRQLLVDADHRYLKLLHPDLMQFKMRLLEPCDQIVASLIETRHHHNNNPDAK